MNVFDVDALESVGIASSFEADQFQHQQKAAKLSPKLSKKSPRRPHSGRKEKKKSAKVKKEVGADLMADFGLQTVDDLLDRAKSVDDASEIATDIEDEDDRSPSPLRSILAKSPQLVDKTPRSSRSRVHYSLEEVTEVRSRSPSPQPISTARASKSEAYSDDFDAESESIQTETALDSLPVRRRRRRLYSDDFVSATESKWSSVRRDLRRSESVESHVSDSYSEFSDYSAVESSRR